MLKVDAVFQLAAATSKTMPELLHVVLKQVELNASMINALAAAGDGNPAAAAATREAFEESKRVREQVFKLITVTQEALSAANAAIEAAQADG